MKKGLLIILSLTLLITLSGCFNNPLSSGLVVQAEKTEWSACAGIEVQASKHDASTPIPVTFFYGQHISTYPGQQEYDAIQSVEVKVLLSGKNEPKHLFEESLTLYSKELLPNDFFIDDYLCTSSWNIGADIEYSHNFSFEVDLSTFDYKEGRIGISVSLTRSCETCQSDTGYVTDVEDTFIYFSNTNGTIKFE